MSLYLLLEEITIQSLTIYFIKKKNFGDRFRHWLLPILFIWAIIYIIEWLSTFEVAHGIRQTY